MVFTIAPICLVASPERSASRCTSSATTVNPRPASPAEAAWIAAFIASTFVCSVMSEISSTISPISCEDSPSRLIRLAVSWIWSRMPFMPEIAFCTACWPFSAAASDALATSADWVALLETSLMVFAIPRTWALVLLISCDCLSLAASICTVVCCAESEAVVTWSAAVVMRLTSVRNSSIAKFTESATAPVMSSPTVAFTVRSPSAKFCISFMSRRIAAWFRSFWRLTAACWVSASSRLRCSSRMKSTAMNADTATASNPSSITA